jgi:HK97 family phage major capsid protein
MRKTLKALQDAKAKLVDEMKAMLDAAGDRSLTAEEDAAYAALEARLEDNNKQLAREQRLQEAERTAVAAAISDVHNREEDRPWASFDEQLLAIVAAGTPHGVNFAGVRGGVVDPRLFAGPTGGSAGVGSDGGFLIRKDFSADLLRQAFEVGVLTSRCDTTELSADSDSLEVVYIDETSRETGSRWGGVQVYRAAEAETVTGTHKPKLGKWECRLEDIIGIAYLTERLVRDGSAMVDVFRKGFTEETSFTVDNEIYRGTGVAQILGLLSHIYSSTTGLGSVVSVAKESGQANDTIVAENVMKMWSKVHPRSKSRGIWLYNTECLPQLQSMQIGTGVSGQLVFMPPGGVSGQPYATMYGRPALDIEHASALGDLGDIMYVDLSQFKLITKGGTKEDVSIHVRFLYNERTFRWVTPINGAPKLKAAITPFKGASGSKLSPFVTLAAR